MTPSADHARRPFRVVAVNVNGLRGHSKRKAFFAWLQKQRHDVVLLSETHSKDDGDTQGWLQQGAGPGRPWQGHAFCAHNADGSGRAGVAVLLSSQIVGQGATEPSIEYQDEGGRAIRVEWTTPWGQRMAAVAVYAPADPTARPAFLSTTYLEALEAGQQSASLIVGGDFNCSMTAADVRPVEGTDPAASSRMRGAQELRDANEEAGLVDVWRLQHPNVQQPTHCQASSAGRIDYVFLSRDLVEEGWVKRTTQHGRFPSDHRPVEARLQPPAMPAPGPPRWRFPNHLLGDPDFVTALGEGMDTVLQHQQQLRPRQDPGTEFEQLKAHTVAMAKAVQQARYRRRTAALRTLRGSVRVAQRAYEAHPTDATQANLLHAEQALTSHEQQQHEQQAAAMEPLWELYGERPNGWFFQLGKQPHEPQVISHVARPGSSGETVSTATAAGAAVAADILADYFAPEKGGLFSCSTTEPQCQQDMLQSLDMQLSEQEQQQCHGPTEDGSITLEEAAAALASLPRGKAPGSDGLTYEFYAAFWSRLGAPLVAAFNHAFSQEQGMLSAQQRLGVIVLIHKGGGKPREQPSSYRPITLLNCDTKLVAKLLTLRISGVLGSVIDETQTAFVPGRDIGDNVLLHIEEIEYAAEVHQPGCVLFLDFSQAYDRLDRGWLRLCMQSMRFPASTMRWVQLLLAGTQGCVSINGGHTSRTFDIPSGCAQGSPISPLLFTIAAQPLAAKCRAVQAAALLGFESISLPDGSPAPPSHQHADDTSLHAANRRSANVLLQQAVEPFCRASGARLNRGKCQGMELGSSTPFVGTDPDSGVPFPDTQQQPIRHLGILLSAQGVMQHAEQLFRERLQTITWRCWQWAKQDLTLMGRALVAKQMMASVVSYHAQFVPVPEQLMTRIHRRITAFVLGKGCLTEQQLTQRQDSPPAAVACLPTSMGGISQVDVRAHTAAMQAKVPAALLHPKRAAWKAFMRANLHRALPGLGEAVLVQQSKQPLARATARLGLRHRAYLSAFQATGMQRHTPHDAMSRQQIQLELLVGNHSVGRASDGLMLPTASSVPRPLPQQAGATVGEVLGSLSLQPGADPVVLPAAWRHTLQQGDSDDCWRTNPSDEWVVHSTTEGSSAAYRVQHDGSLKEAELPEEADTSTWAPCCVVDTAQLTHPTGVLRRQQQAEAQQQQQQQQQQPPEPALFLVGRWDTIRVDPSVWGFGHHMGVLQFTVRAATQRLLQHQCSRANPKGWVPGVGVRPRLWRDRDGAEAPQTGLQQLEAGQKRRFEERLAASNAAGSSGSTHSGGNANQFSDTALAAAYHAPWMAPSQPRQLPRQRAADRASAITAQRQQQQQQQQQPSAPARDDLADPLTGHTDDVDTAQHAWVAAYKRAANKQLPHRLRELGWRVLHAGVEVGARRMLRARSTDTAQQFTCQHPQCQQQQEPPLETTSHALLTCPAAAAAWQWFARRVWQKVQPGAEVQVSSARLMLLDDCSAWAPPQDKAQLWTHLRLLMLETLWQMRCSLNTGGAVHTAQAAACSFKAKMQRQIRMDWLRVDSDIRLEAGVPAMQLNGRDPTLTKRAFDAKWGRLVRYVQGAPLADISTASLAQPTAA
jgi:exonuclease III